MKKTLKIKGMSCEHCIARVENALNAIPGVSATVDLGAGRAVVTSDAEIPDDTLIGAVSALGFSASVAHGLFH